MPSHNYLKQKNKKHFKQIFETYRNLITCEV